ncbi:MAG: LacI family DNA-binding transcriptional regulator [Aquisalimonadaceae bacterium]
MTRKSRPTSADVARLANVSQSAVSRTFTLGASVAPETKRKVLEAAKSLGYRPNAFARSLITRNSRIIAVVLAYLDNSFYPRVLELLSRGLQRKGYHVMLFLAAPGGADDVLQEILQYQVAGILMASATLSSVLAKECEAAGIPIVLFNRYIPGSPNSSVTSDNYAGGVAVGEFLVAAGHERIAYIAGASDASTNKDRWAGLIKALSEAGRACWGQADGAYSYDRAAQAAREMFSDRAPPDRPDAVFVANDHMALAVMDVLRHELRLKVPEDVSVVGYDDVPQAAWPAYDLTTVEQAVEPMVDAAINILLGQVSNERVQRHNVVIPGDLVLRGSARLPGGLARTMP